MLKGHPKGLFVLALANMGERFGYYTMLAIFVLFMQAKFGFSEATTSTIFGGFLAAVYFLPLIGGIIADKVLGYGKTIALGIVVMFCGYVLLAIPTGTDTASMVMMFGALLLIALGTGFFKGNLQALVGNLYDDPRYSAKRDVAFSIFYMCINLGAFFAPTAAEKVSEYFLQQDNYTLSSEIPALTHQANKGTITAKGLAEFSKLAIAQGYTGPVDTTAIDTLHKTPVVVEATQTIVAEQVTDAVAETGVVVVAQTETTAIDSTALMAATVAATDKADIAAAAANYEAAKQGLGAFGKTYIVSLSRSYNFGFAVACFSLVISMLIFLVFRRFYKKADQTEKQKQKSGDNAAVIELTPKQTKDRLVALGLVFAVVIFFWMAFHQNGLTMTWFARDYTAKAVMGWERFMFSLLTLVPFAVAFYGVLNIFQSSTSRGRLIGMLVTLVGAGSAYYAYSTFDATMAITPQIFQQFNAYFIVLLTPVAVAFFAWLNKKGREPLAPRKIGIGMIVAALGFVVLAIGSVGLPTPDAAKEVGGVASSMLVSPNWLISTYFTLTIAELFLSPMGISFVSKVAPPKYKGLAQGGWLAATAIGNYLVALIGYLWGGIDLWILWSILIVCCLLSATFLFSQMKRLENTTRNS